MLEPASLTKIRLLAKHLQLRIDSLLKFSCEIAVTFSNVPQCLNGEVFEKSVRFFEFQTQLIVSS